MNVLMFIYDLMHVECKSVKNRLAKRERESFAINIVINS